jgi:hypothetical protein
MKKTIAAIVAGFVLISAGRFLLHNILMAHQYAASMDVWRPQDQFMHRIWILYVANFVLAVGAALIYARGVESKPWLGQGIRFGILLALVTAVPQSLIEYAVYPIHHEMALHWILGEGAIAVLLGVLLAAICQPPKSAA